MTSELSPVVPTHDAWRRSLLCIACTMSVSLIGLAASACSGGQQAAQAANAAISVETTQLFVTIQNKAGAPLLNITVAVVPAGGPGYTHLISRLENGEKRDISHNELASRDGTGFSLRMVRPKSVKVSAEDLAGTKYDVEVPWK